MKRFVQNKELLAADMDGELVMMSTESGNYYGLSGVGPRVWTLLDEPRSVAELVSGITEEYDIDEQTCLRDVEGFVASLLEGKLIVEV